MHKCTVYTRKTSAIRRQGSAQGAGSENHGAIWIEVGRVSFCGDILPQGPWPERSENRRGKTARSLYANADRSYSLVGLGEALHRMREKELDKICFKRGQDASQASGGTGNPQDCAI